MTESLERLRTALAGRYAIEREVGAGGMATVYLAEDVKHHRKVALKVMRPELAASLGPTRFLREIETAARLQHPHILPLHDSGETDGFLYFVMPFVEGESLRARLARDGELPVGEAARIVRDVVDALSHAHGQGVVHRDIKPDNVLLSGRHALVTDFGVAKAVSEATGRQGITTVGVALGTPAYMAPEQAAADPHVDHRADIYAVGALAYELLTGRPPFEGANAQQVLSAHVTQAPDPVTRRRATVPAVLETIVMRCLEKKPADRWQSADELLVQLEAFVTPSGGITPTATRPFAGVRPAVRRPVAALAGAAALMVTAAVGVWAVMRGGDGGSAAKPRIVVLPPRNLGPAEQAYVADGIAEEINNRLVALSGLEVIGRTSAERYRDSDKTPRQIGEELGAQYLLALRVASEGPARQRRLRVSAELLWGETEAQLWGKSFTADQADDYFRVQEEIAAEVARGMGVALGAGERERLGVRPTTNAEAYDYYLRGTAAWDRGLAVEDFRAAEERFQRAVELDPQFAAAWIGLGLSHIEQYWFYGDRTDRRRELARAALDRAAALTPEVPEVDFALGIFHYHGYYDYARALERLQRAVTADPGRAQFHEWIGYVYRRSGRIDEAITALERAAQLDPGSGRVIGGLGETYGLAGRYREGRAMVDRAHDLSPTDWPARWIGVHIAIAQGDRAGAGERARVAIARLGAPSLLVNRPDVLRQWALLLTPADRRVLQPFPPLTAAIADTAGYYLARGAIQTVSGQDARADYDAAATAYRRVTRDRPDEFKYFMGLARALAALDRRADAIQAAERAVELAAVDRYEGLWAYATLAEVLLQFGERERAAEELARFAAAAPLCRDLVRHDPLYADLRDHPRLRQLLR